MASVKKELRKHIAAVLRATETAEIAQQSERLAERICALPEFRDAKALSVYLEMPKEAATTGLLNAAFEANKKVYVPKITGRGAEDLKMVHALSLDDIGAFPKVRCCCCDYVLGHYFKRSDRGICVYHCRTTGKFQTRH